jgi:hypothetical protein
VSTQDGVAFLEAAEENAFDLILIDAADFESKDCEDDPDALEVPPPTFVDPAFLMVCTSTHALCTNHEEISKSIWLPFDCVRVLIILAVCKTPFIYSQIFEARVTFKRTHHNSGCRSGIK